MNVSRHAGRPDAELEGLAAGGDREAFAELYNRHFDRVYDFALHLLRDADEAADVAQDTFLKAMAALSPKKKTAAFTTWVLTIARNTALNRLRSRKTAASSLEETEQPEAVYREVDAGCLGSPEEALQAKELAGLVWQAATALDPKQYSLLDLQLRQGLDSGEMAEVLGTSKNNAYVMMSRLKDSVEESITAFIMARRGRRECAALDEMLTSRGTIFFDTEMRKGIARHIENCPTCQEQRKKLVSPTAIFGALAAVPVPLGLKQRALAEAMGQWATLAGSEAGKAGGLLSRLAQPIRSPFTALRQAGWFTGWKGTALLVGTALVAGGIIGGALVLGGSDGEDGGSGEGQLAAGLTDSPTPASTASPVAASPSPTPTPIPLAPTTAKIVLECYGDDPSTICIMNTDGSELTRFDIVGGGIMPDWSPDGSRIAFLDFNLDINVMNADGTNIRRLTGYGTGGIGRPRWSPDGDRILFSSQHEGNAEVYVMDSDGTGLTNLTNNPSDDTDPTWSPDGTRIAFASRRPVVIQPGGEIGVDVEYWAWDIYVMNADGSNVVRLTSDPALEGQPAWSPDGTRIAFLLNPHATCRACSGSPEIYVMNADGSGATNLTNHPAADGFPAWSPDGTHIIFSSDRDGSFDEIYVMNADGSAITRLTTDQRGYTRPVWWSP